MMPSLTVNGYALNYAEQGAGEPVVLVHGSLQDQRYWAPQMEPLGARYRVIALSLRHYWPEKWDGVGDDFTIAQHVEDVAAFIRALGAGPVRLVGHSRGGHIAFRLAGAHPELLRQLVLAEPGGELDESLGGAPPAGKQAAVFREAAELIRQGRVEEGLSFFADYTGGKGAWAKRPEFRKQIARDNAMTLLGQINEQRKPYSLDAVKLIRTPTLLVGGANTQPHFNAILAALEQQIPGGARRVTVPNATHGMSLENPADFNAAVLAFFADG
jgi:pimeloyl-ACP methyl ester carboxylesterase